MDKNKIKLRPPRIYKNKKGYYYKVNGKKRYIKLDEKISEKQLININIKNIAGYIPRKRKAQKKVVVAKGQQPIKPEISSSSFIPSNFSLQGTPRLYFSQPIVPQLQYYPASNLPQLKNQTKSDSDTQAFTKIISGLLENQKAVLQTQPMKDIKTMITDENLKEKIFTNENIMDSLGYAVSNLVDSKMQDQYYAYDKTQRQNFDELTATTKATEPIKPPTGFLTGFINTFSPSKNKVAPVGDDVLPTIDLEEEEIIYTKKKPEEEEEKKKPEPKEEAVPAPPPKKEEAVAAPPTTKDKDKEKTGARFTNWPSGLTNAASEDFIRQLKEKTNYTDTYGAWKVGALTFLATELEKKFTEYEEELRAQTKDYDKFLQQLKDYKNSNKKESGKKNVEWDRIVLNIGKLKKKNDKVQLGRGGKYTNDNDGLYTNEISDILHKHIPEEYIPVIANDQIKTLLPFVNKNTQKFGFVINTDNSGGMGKHWRSVFISRPEASVEYYDSLVSEPDKKFVNDVKKLIDKMDDNVYYKFKVNQVKDQSDDSNNCGYFAMKFLMDRFNNTKFKKASHYDKVDLSNLGEKEIKKFKKYI